MSWQFENAARAIWGIRNKLRKTTVIEVFSFTPYAIIVSAVTALIIVQLQKLFQTESAHSTIATAFAFVGLVLGVATFLESKSKWRRSHPFPVIEDKYQFLAKIFLLSAQIGIVLLPISAYFAVWQSHYDQLEWYEFGFLDKRWLICLYWTAIITFLILPPILWKILEIREQIPATNDGDTPSVPLDSTNSKSKRRVPGYVKLLLALFVAYFMYGPPWNIAQMPFSIDFHEEVHLGPLQAIDKGYLPNIGPAAQQYGPGFQLAMYAMMKLSGQFNLLGFKQAQATIDFIGYGIFAIIAFQILDIPYALLAVLFSVSVSPFFLIPWSGTSLVTWGWPNPLRYVGSLILVVILPAALLSQKRWRLRLVGVGLLWGLFIWLSPENLVTGIISSALLCALLWATNTLGFRKVVQGFVLVILGAVVFWLPIAAFYMLQGRLGEYFSNIFLVGSQVLNGFSNYLPADDILQNPHLSNIFYYGLPLLIMCGLAVLFKNMVLAQPLDRKRLYLLALLLVTLTNLFGSLTRSDASHLVNTLISFPIVLALLIQDSPGLFRIRGLPAVFTRALVVILVLMFVASYGLSDIPNFASQFSSRTMRFFTASSQPVGDAVPDGIAFKRTGYQRLSYSVLVQAQPSTSDTPVTVMDLFNTLDAIRTIVGGNKVYVDTFPYTVPSMVYFLADLTQPPLSVEPSTMVFSNEDATKFDANFKAIASQVDYIITVRPQIPEVTAFMATHPGATSIKRMFGGYVYFIFGVFQDSDTF